ncbi:type IV toxin-antitoxin system AbiEi family antitoxin domain-containing protein [Nocardioides montaniterrae]
MGWPQIHTVSFSTGCELALERLAATTHARAMDLPDRRIGMLGALLNRQSGVVRRAQLLELGFAPHDVRRMVRHRDLVPLHPGVLINHTGTPTWEQRAWAAVLACWPAALRAESAQRASSLRLMTGPDDGRPIELMVPASRSLRPPAGVVVRRSRSFDQQVDMTALPPRQHTTDWVLDLADEAPREIDAIASIADAVGAQRLRPDEALAALARRTRSRRRAFIAAVLADARDGACSVLEQRYLQRVERAHGLPSADRQVRAAAKGTIYRDVVYQRFRTVVELDGRLHHTRAGDRDRDLDRDLDAAVGGLLTLRLGWGQTERACATAVRVAAVLQIRGWTGTATRCPACG